MIAEGAKVGVLLKWLLGGGSDTLPIVALTVKGGPSGFRTFEIEMMELKIIRRNCEVSDKMITLPTDQYLMGKMGLLAWLAPGENVPNGIDPIINIQTP